LGISLLGESLLIEHQSTFFVRVPSQRDIAIDDPYLARFSIGLEPSIHPVEDFIGCTGAEPFGLEVFKRARVDMV
jgi:hypothetical protein